MFSDPYETRRASSLVFQFQVRLREALHNFSKIKPRWPGLQTRHVLLACALLTAAAGTSPPTKEIDLGEPVKGVRLGLHSDGSLSVNTDGAIVMDDGTKVILNNGAWTRPAVAPGAVETVRPLDLAVDEQKYVGRRIFLRSVGIFGSSVDWAVVRLPGGKGPEIDLSTLSRTVVRYLVTRCGSFGESSACTFDVEADVEPYDGSEGIHLTHASLSGSSGLALFVAHQ